MSIVHVPFYPSDWLAGTRGMSDAETGVYITLIARIYEMAGPIERDDERLFRLCGCRSKSAFVKALGYLISEGKIIEVDGMLFNEKAEKVITETVEKSSKAKAAAQSRWNRKSNKNKGGDNANASPEHMPEACQPKPKPYIKEDTNVSLLVHTDGVNDLSSAVRKFNDIANRVGWSQVQKLTPTRSKQLRQRLKDCGGLSGWDHALDRASSSDFLLGRTERPWTGFGFDWLIKQANFTKLMEGNYDNRTGNPQNGTGRDRASGMVSAFAEVARDLERGTGGR